MDTQSTHGPLGGVALWVIYADLSEWRGELSTWSDSPDKGVLFVVFEFGDGTRMVSSGASVYGLNTLTNPAVWRTYADYQSHGDYYLFDLVADTATFSTENINPSTLPGFVVRLGQWATDTDLQTARDRIYT